MLLRSSSTPVLGSLLSSKSESPNRDFDIHPLHNSDCHHKKISFLHGGHSSFSSFSCNSSSITPSMGGYSDMDHESGRKSLGGGFRRAQSDGNLEGLGGAELEEFNGSKALLPRSSRKPPPHHSLLQTIPSFSIYNSLTNDYLEEEEEEEEEEEGRGGGESEDNGFLIRSVTIGDNINGVGSGEFSFGKNRELIMEEEGAGVSELGTFSVEDEEGRPKSPRMYLATGLGIGQESGGGGGGGDFSLAGYGGGDREKLDMEEYYMKMVEENPGNPLFLRNYAQYLYQSKGDLQGAEAHYARAILSDPSDGDMLCQYAKIVWELHHDHERASSYFERAVNVAPEDSHVHAAYASFLWETEDEEENSLQQEFGVPSFQTIAMASVS